MGLWVGVGVGVGPLFPAIGKVRTPPLRWLCDFRGRISNCREKRARSAFALTHGNASQAGAQRLHAAGLRGEQGEERLQRRRPRRGARQPHEAPRECSQGRRATSHALARVRHSHALSAEPTFAVACRRVRGISSRSSLVYWGTPSSGCVHCLHIVARPGSPSPGTRMCVGGGGGRCGVSLWRRGGEAGRGGGCAVQL